MHKGKVREMGSHQQLLAQRGIYYRLYQLQYKDQEIPSVLAVPAGSSPTRGRGERSEHVSHCPFKLITTEFTESKRFYEFDSLRF